MSKTGTEKFTTVLDYVSPSIEDAYLQTTDISASIFTSHPKKFTNMSNQNVEVIFRGKTEYGGYAAVTIPSNGDHISWITLQIQVGSWWYDAILYNLEREFYQYMDTSGIWYWANGLGAALIERVWLEADGYEFDSFPGEWIDVWSRLFLHPEKSDAIRRDGLGCLPTAELLTVRPADYYPTESGRLLIPLPFWCLRGGGTGAIPICAIKESCLSLHIKFRPFAECVRIQSGTRASCTDTPLSKSFVLKDTRVPFNNINTFTTDTVAPLITACTAMINYGYVDESERLTMMTKPFTQLIQRVATFRFEAPLRHAVAVSADSVIVNLPLEASHTVDEIVWILRRTVVKNNNDWFNYSASGESTPDANRTPLLRSAIIKVSGADWISGDESYFRSSYAGQHSGITAGYNSFIYHYTFGCSGGRPEDVQPGAAVNASVAPISLVLNVRQPGAVTEEDRGWEVIVFVLYRNWLRYQRGLVAPVFE